MSGNKERPEKGPMYGIPADDMDEFRRKLMIEKHMRRADNYVQQTEARGGLRLREKITCEVLGLITIIVGNCLAVLLTMFSGNIFLVSSVIPVCGFQAVFWFRFLLDELCIRPF